MNTTVQIFKREPLLYCNNKFIMTLIYLFIMMLPFNVKTCTGFVYVKNPINKLMSFIQGSYTSPFKNHNVVSGESHENDINTEESV
jgi:hypothetical protein